ncbi:HAD family hydrolase [Methylacidiphilum caldifontis]|uniref:Phosphatase n=1 Tax=Methylacidiphilum caldifontis TaxID=2795386 RepID=A0A4Y8PG57_9BACT|nr:HAD family phosphatase [Methylacidiphilum caldifontis]QSR88080.1 HAD family phosphatase [Methylacidiphilum caldifontis]TFE69615.1 phosphatase [Methylacidiphilum caldifontis]
MEKHSVYPPWAALFDWDGVIVDSLKQHEKSWSLLAAELGKEIDQDFMEKTFGMKNEKIISEYLGWAQNLDEINRLAKRKEELYKKIVTEEGLHLVKGIKDFLFSLKEKNIPMAICSSTTKTNISFVLQQLGLSSYFGQFVCAEDVKESKPSPMPYLLTAQKLRYPPSHCVVFEDAPVGVESAIAAGMHVVALTTTRPKKSLERADIVVDGWEELSIEKIEALVDHNSLSYHS